MTRALRILCSLTVASAVALALAAPATAGRHGSGRSVGEPTTIASGLAGPLQLEVGKHGILVGQSFAATVSRVGWDGTVTNLTTDDTGVDGVAAAGRGSVAYTNRSGLDSEELVAEVNIWHPDGTTETLADIAAWETANNPDAGNVYGFSDLSDECLAQVPPDFQPYSGAIDAHPYALLRTRGGWYVADAGVNAILKVSDRGRVSTVYVFKPQPATVTAEIAEAFGMPDCVVGESYAFEPVPTDVEYDRRGGLVVSLLPGGPEDASLGARGSVVRIALKGHHDHRAKGHVGWGRGHARVLASGFLGAANVAVDERGRVYVSELFANQISVVRGGRGVPVASVPSPAGLEYSRGSLVASTDVFANGSIVRMRLR